MKKQRIPVRISAFFWVTAAIIGWFNSMSFIGTIIWIGIIFVSILVHEYGHALTAKFFGQFPKIELVAFGGVTYPDGPKLPLWKEFFVVLNGPVFGFMLFLLGTLLLYIPAIATSQIAPIIQMFRVVNLFWTVVNLLPVLPLDGGQLLRIILEATLGFKGLKVAMITGMIISFGLAAVCMFVGWFLIGAIFFLFAFQNVQTWKATKSLTPEDQSEKLQEELFVAEEEMLKGNEDQAEKLLEKLIKDSNKGMLHVAATQHLARLKFKKMQIKDTYDLLLTVRKELTPEYLELLHLAAFEMRDFQVVSELSAKCFQNEPSLEIALRNAIALSVLKDAKASVGWLDAAIRTGLQNVEEVTGEKAFDSIREDPEFLKFIDNYKNNS